MRFSFKYFLLTTAVLGVCLPSGAQTIVTVAGNCVTAGYLGDGGPASLASLWIPDDLAFDSQGNYYIADAGSDTVRKVNLSTDIITTYAGAFSATGGYSGDGGPATQALLDYPSGIAIDSNNNLYIADFYNSVIRKVSAATGLISTFAGSFTVSGGVTTGLYGYSGDGGPAAFARMGNPVMIRFDPSDRHLVVSDAGNDTVREIDMGTGIITTVAGNGTQGYSGDNGPATQAQLNQPEGIAFDASGNLYFTDSANGAVRKVDSSTGLITTVAGSGVTGFSGDGGPATLAQLGGDVGSVTFTCNGNMILTDDMNNRVRMVDKATGVITTVMGTGVSGCSTSGTAVLATNLSHPEALVFDPSGNLYLVDYEYSLVQVVTGGLCPQTPTPTPTSTPSSTPTPTLTPRPTRTPTFTPTPSDTPTFTSTPTLTFTPTVTDSPTNSFSPTPSGTPTSSPTPRDTPTSTSTPTVTFTPTVTSSSTVTSTPTAGLVSGAYTVEVGVYNEAGELIQTLKVLQSSQSVDSLVLQGNSITSLNGPNGQIDLYCQGVLVATWDGKDGSRNPVSNGTYIIKVDNIDPTGTVSSLARQVVVSRQLAHISAVLYNEAGEVVRHLSAWVEDPSGASMNGVSLSGTVLNVGSGAGAPATLQILVQSSGGPFTLSWDGTNDEGSLVTAGTYILSVHWDSGQGGLQDISRDILVVDGTGRNNGGVTAFPNFLSLATGQTRVTFKDGSNPGSTLSVRVYAVSGELVGVVQGAPGTSQAFWDASGAASGLYLAAVGEQSAKGGITHPQILKIVVLR